jgi:hypothetical protein
MSQDVDELMADITVKEEEDSETEDERGEEEEIKGEDPDWFKFDVYSGEPIILSKEYTDKWRKVVDTPVKIEHLAQQVVADMSRVIYAKTDNHSLRRAFTVYNGFYKAVNTFSRLRQHAVFYTHNPIRQSSVVMLPFRIRYFEEGHRMRTLVILLCESLAYGMDTNDYWEIALTFLQREFANKMPEPMDSPALVTLIDKMLEFFDTVDGNVRRGLERWSFVSNKIPMVMALLYSWLVAYLILRPERQETLKTLIDKYNNFSKNTSFLK